MPKTQDPQYVRLAVRMQTGMLVDTFGSGWSISGMDVRKFPEDSNRKAQKFVRAELNDGKLEPASLAEWDEVHDPALAEAVLAQNPGFKENASGFQEAHLQQAAADSRRRLEASRQARLEADDDYETDDEARQRELDEAIEAQEGMDSDDPEEQEAMSSGQRPRKKAGKKK